MTDAARSARALAYWADPERRKRHLESLRDPANRAVHRERQLAAWADPVKRATLLARIQARRLALWTPEMDAAALLLAESGLPLYRVAARVGVEVRALKRRLGELRPCLAAENAAHENPRSRALPAVRQYGDVSSLRLPAAADAESSQRPVFLEEVG